MDMEPQSTLSGFSVQTNSQTKTNFPSLTVGGFSSKVGNTKDETLCYKQKDY